MLYFIIDADGNVGHPTKKADMIRRWLKTGRAKIKDRGADWMILKITKKIDREKTIPCQFRIGIDPGYLNIGYAIYKENTVLHGIELEEKVKQKIKMV